MTTPSPSRSAVAGTGLRTVPVTFRDAAAFVDRWHRHHHRPQGHKFSIGLADPTGLLVGVVIVGRPVARHLDDGQTAQVTRCCTNGAPNGCSMLLGAAWRAAKALGYTRILTYTRADEPGTSLHAAGWRVIATRRPHHGWSRVARPRASDPTANVPKTVWEQTHRPPAADRVAGIRHDRPTKGEHPTATVRAA